MKTKLLIILIILAQAAFPQSTFYNVYDSTKMFRPTDIAFSEYGEIYVCAFSWEINNPYYNNYIVKLNESGNLIEKWWEKDTISYYSQYTNIQLVEDTIFIFGIATPHDIITDSPYVFLKIFTSQLNEIKSFRYYLDNSLYRGVKGHCKIKCDEDSFLFFSSAIKNEALVPMAPFLFKISKNGTFLSELFDEVSEFWHILYDVIIKPNDAGYYTFMLENSPEIYNEGFIYDYDYHMCNLVKTQMPNGFDRFFSAIKVNDSIFYISGSYKDPEPFSIRQVGIMKMNYNGTAYNTYLYNPLTDSVSYTAYYNSLDTLSDGNLIMCSSYGIDGQFVPQLDPSFICLYKFTPELDLVWQRYIGGDANYEAYTMRIASDDGIVVAGCYSPTPPQATEKDMIIFKTNSEGIITGVEDGDQQIETTEAVLFPNPAHDQITVDFSRVYHQATLQLIDISGKTVLNKRLTTNRQTVDISTLPEGTYAYRIFNREGLDEQGKVVVE